MTDDREPEVDSRAIEERTQGARGRVARPPVAVVTVPSGPADQRGPTQDEALDSEDPAAPPGSWAEETTDPGWPDPGRGRPAGSPSFVPAACLGLLMVLAGGAGIFSLASAPTASAATVNGVSIPESTLDGQLDAVGATTAHPTATQKQAACIAGLSGAGAPGSKAMSSAATSAILTGLIVTEYQDQELAKLHAPVTAAVVNAARQDLETELEGSQTCPGAGGTKILSQVPASSTTAEVNYLASEEQLIASLAHLDLSTKGLQTYYQAHPDQFGAVCLVEATFTSQADATAAAGTDLSKQPSAQQGCLTNIQLATNPQYAGLASELATVGGVGKVSAPTQVQDPTTGSSTWAVLEITSEPIDPFKATQVRLTALGEHQSVLSGGQHTVTKAKVTVNPRYGTWDRTTGQVVAPKK
jgi:hypothetical protein